ncbi:MAG: hypothetical protein E6H84_10980 [Chloroflexi bacterium]|nr:MAG: hypothetical protein E6H84_10980 [Chloroflexota bacterium]TMG70106.1 MAG: hypothetical protein E6H81_08430 [Chloroflexota bacterium]
MAEKAVFRIWFRNARGDRVDFTAKTDKDTYELKEGVVRIMAENGRLIILPLERVLSIEDFRRARGTGTSRPVRARRRS